MATAPNPINLNDATADGNLKTLKENLKKLQEIERTYKESEKEDKTKLEKAKAKLAEAEKKKAEAEKKKAEQEKERAEGKVNIGQWLAQVIEVTQSVLEKQKWVLKDGPKSDKKGDTEAVAAFILNSKNETTLFLRALNDRNHVGAKSSYTGVKTVYEDFIWKRKWRQNEAEKCKELGSEKDESPKKASGKDKVESKKIMDIAKELKGQLERRIENMKGERDANREQSGHLRECSNNFIERHEDVLERLKKAMEVLKEKDVRNCYELSSYWFRATQRCIARFFDAIRPPKKSTPKKDVAEKVQEAQIWHHDLEEFYKQFTREWDEKFKKELDGKTTAKSVKACPPKKSK